jgi:hypothetical protein
MRKQQQGRSGPFPGVKLWAILGDPRTGKSTIIGNLVSQTTRGPGGFRDVLLRGGGYLRVFALRQACQEARRSPEALVGLIAERALGLMRSRPAISVSRVNVLLALRFAETNGYPPGHQYLSFFVQHGWSIESLVLLNYEDRHEFYHYFGAPTYDLLDSARLLQNPFHREWIVGQVRNHFGWA